MTKNKSDTENVAFVSSILTASRTPVLCARRKFLKSRRCCRRLSGDSTCASHHIIIANLQKLITYTARLSLKSARHLGDDFVCGLFCERNLLISFVL
jgi:hypothetical protein